MTELAGAFQGMSREDARVAVADALAEQGFLVQREEHDHAVGHCERCGTVVEPFLSDQWFVKMEALAQPALERARAGELSFVPSRFGRVFEQWLENVRDWCISRQLWWGHRIPAWYCDECEAITVSRDDVTHCATCGSANVRQDEDVLDTWFSSALWPFSTMGWPAGTPDLERFYPTSTLVTGYDILFFWVARMVFMGVHFTGKMPFQTVVLHGLVRDAKGQKMSKSKGNGVDPMDVIEKYGADALRFTLATNTSPGNDQRFVWEKVEGARNFINKIWNASRFVLMNLGEDFVPQPLHADDLDLADQWILDRLQATIAAVSDHLSAYDFGEAARAMYDFAWDDFCDWYIEFAKIGLYGEDEERKQSVQSVLYTVLTRLLTLLHPYIPFVTEEIWQALPNTSSALVAAQWPEAISDWQNADAVRKMNLVMDAIRAVRNVRAELQLAPSQSVSMQIQCDTDGDKKLFEQVRDMIQRFCHADHLDIMVGGTAPRQSATQVVTGARIHIPLVGLIDMDAERERLGKEEKRLVGEVERLEKKLANAGFVAKAPADVVAAEREKLADYAAKLAAVRERIESLAE
ncbi:hypothetical protein GCM10025858_04140 [Alicyclobacillus sacchari]|nr:hypothetical protein GCM10025858_04140 [Alicyclobacillus sacchari]